MIAINTSPLNISRLRKRNVWYSVKDGNWDDPTVWKSNALYRGRVSYIKTVAGNPTLVNQIVTYPNPGDDVVINHNVVFNAGVFNVIYILNSLIVTANGSFKAGTLGLFRIANSLQVDGVLDMTVSGSSIYLGGVYNYVRTLNTHVNATIYYDGAMNQDIMPLAYGNLYLITRRTIILPDLSTKYLVNNLSVAGNLTIEAATFELGIYNLAIAGQTSFNGSAQLSKTGAGNVLFTGYVEGGNGNFNSLNFSGGNPEVEFKGGFRPPYYQNFDSGQHFKTGTGLWKFSTNNQVINTVYATIYKFDCPILISGAITVTYNDINTSPIQFNNTVNGDNASSTFNNNGQVYLNTTAMPMVTGIFNYQYGANSRVAYVFNGNYTLPYTSYTNLLISGSGTKTLGGDTIIAAKLDLSNYSGNGLLDAGAYGLTVNGITYFTGATGLIKSSSGGSLLFVGLMDHLDAGNMSYLDFTASNCDIEFRGGLNLPYGSNGLFKTGTGTWKFSTNSQSLNTGYVTQQNFDCAILVSGDITLIIKNLSGSLAIFKNTVNGDSVNSILDCRIAGTFPVAIHFYNPMAPMITGKLYTNQLTGNNIYYDYPGNQEITPSSDPTPGYANLILAGSGVKKLLGNISVKGNYIVIEPATLNTNGYGLTNP